MWIIPFWQIVHTFWRTQGMENMIQYKVKKIFFYLQAIVQGSQTTLKFHSIIQKLPNSLYAGD